MNHKHTLTRCYTLLLSLAVFFLIISERRLLAQGKNNPVTWAIKAEKKGAQKYQLIYTATIEKNWHIYAQRPGEGPVATKIVLEKNPLLSINTKDAKETGKLIEHFDAGFGKKLKYYENTLTLTQEATLRSPVSTRIKGYIEYMVCDDKRCVPPRKETFQINLPQAN